LPSPRIAKKVLTASEILPKNGMFESVMEKLLCALLKDELSYGHGEQRMGACGPCIGTSRHEPRGGSQVFQLEFCTNQYVSRSLAMHQPPASERVTLRKGAEHVKTGSPRAAGSHFYPGRAHAAVRKVAAWVPITRRADR
jgi:hypothetical protein